MKGVCGAVATDCCQEEGRDRKREKKKRGKTRK
jgi:hypothetical protein